MSGFSGITWGHFRLAGREKPDDLVPSVATSGVRKLVYEYEKPADSAFFPLMHQLFQSSPSPSLTAGARGIYLGHLCYDHRWDPPTSL